MPGTAAEMRALARKGAKASAEVRARKAALSPRERALEAIRRGGNLDKLVKELLQAAHGAGDFQGLDPKLRLQAIVRALDYGIGRPGPAASAALAEAPKEPEVPAVDDLFGAEEE